MVGGGMCINPHISSPLGITEQIHEHSNSFLPPGTADGSRLLNRPAPFLKRRQGMAAWCSKLRRQGLPVRNPADELRRKQSSNCHSLESTRYHSNGTFKSVEDVVPRSRPQSVLSGFSSSKSGTPRGPFGGLFSGLVSRRRSSSAIQNHLEQVQSSDRFPAPFAQFNPPCGTDNLQSRSPPTVLEEGPSDTGDLEEFEMLEEMAENSSFSSLTTSFISKLGRTSLKDRLKRAEEKLEKLTTGGIPISAKDVDLSDPTTFSNRDTARENGILATSGDYSGSCQAPNVLLTTENNQSLVLAEPKRSPSPSRVAHGILTCGAQSKPKKVARFHLVRETTSLPREDRSADNSVHEAQELNSVRPDLLCTKINPNGFEDNSTEFDDANSWTSSAAELYDAVEPTPIPSFDSSAGSLCASTKQPKAGLEDKKALPQSRGASTGGEDHLVECTPEPPFPKRSSPRLRSSSGNFGSKSSIFQKSNASYETELINLADDFVEKLKRDQPSNIGRSQTESQPVLRQWITRLEQEVRRFKSENANLTKMRAEREESMRRLEAETKRFEEMKTREMKLFNEYKDSELRKLKKERRVLDEYQRAMRTMPNKQAREEIDRLRAELQEARSDLSRREVRWHSAISRLRTRIEELEAERSELVGRIRNLEEERIRLQSQLACARTPSNALKLHQLRRATSSVSPIRRTLNGVSQSVALSSNRSRPESAKLSPGTESERRLQQQKQFLSSCRLSSRSTSRSGGLDSLIDLRSRPIGTRGIHYPATVSKTSPAHDVSTNQPPLSRAMTERARESVNSGYFTGEEDCQSLTSEDRRKNSGDTKTVSCPINDTSAQAKHDRPSILTSKLNGLGRALENLPIPGTASSGAVVRSITHADGSIEDVYSNGAVVVSYTNGSIKEVFPDGKTIIVSLFNGDIKRTLPDGRVIYHYAADNTVQVTHLDGTEEISYADGRQEIIRPKALLKSESDDRSNASSKLDPTELIARRLPNGDREIRLPNGQREIHSVSGVKCRIYPDGTTKTVFPDGRHETRYASGRLRVKDAQGNLILDARLPVSNRGSQPSHQSAIAPGVPSAECT